MAYIILLADDSSVVKTVAENALSATDYELVTAVNGNEAKRLISSVEPAMVLAAAILPDLDGYEICRMVKSNAGASRVPVYLLTGTFEPFDIDLAKEVEYDGFLTKPLDPQEFMEKVEMAVSTMETSEIPPDTVETEAETTEETAVDEQLIGDTNIADNVLDRIFPEETSPVFPLLTHEQEESSPTATPERMLEEGLEESTAIDEEVSGLKIPEVSFLDGEDEGQEIFPDPQPEEKVVASDDQSLEPQAPSTATESDDGGDDLSWFLNKYPEETDVIPEPIGDIEDLESVEEPEPVGEEAAPSVETSTDLTDDTTTGEAESSIGEDKEETPGDWLKEIDLSLAATGPSAGLTESPASEDVYQHSSLEEVLPEPESEFEQPSFAEDASIADEENLKETDGFSELPQPAVNDAPPDGATTEEMTASVGTDPITEAEESMEQPEPLEVEEPPIALDEDEPTESTAQKTISTESWPVMTAGGPAAFDSADEPPLISDPESFSEEEPGLDLGISLPAEGEGISEEIEEGESPEDDESHQPPKIDLDEEQVELIARRVVDLMSDDLVRRIAWDLVPETAERLIRERIRNIEEELEKSENN